jgi:hypothetical protein
VDVDLVLYTVVGDKEKIQARKKLQIVKIEGVAQSYINDKDIRYRGYTNYFYDRLLGVFVDYHSRRTIAPLFDGKHVTNMLYNDFHVLITRFVNFVNNLNKDMAVDPLKLNEDERKLWHERLTSLQIEAEDIHAACDDVSRNQNIDNVVFRLNDIMLNSLNNVKVENFNIYESDMSNLNDAIAERQIYFDAKSTLSTFGLTIGTEPIYPAEFPISMITPRYRKSFNRQMYRCDKQVQEAEIDVQFHKRIAVNDKDFTSEDIITQPDFNVYFMFNQTVK